MSSLPNLQQADALKELSRREIVRRQCETHPAYLLDRVTCIDATTGETFQFQLLDPDAPWYWQRKLMDQWLAGSKHISLKARQIGITWLAGGLALWTMLYTPGSSVLVVSTKESEAAKVVNRIFDMLLSLPVWLRNGAEIIKPQRSRPTTDIELQFPDGRISRLQALASTPSAGHGSTAALVVLDEYSRQEYAKETWKAVLPTTQGGGRVLVVSTGNGVSSERGGNFFHHLWVNAEEYGLDKRFLPWSQHPDRDEDWYRRNAEAMPPADRGEQYPRNEREAFILTGSPAFDVEALAHYSETAPNPLYRMDFTLASETPRQAKIRKWENGHLRIYEEPDEERKYAIGADVATGRGQDFSAAYVVDLSNMSLVAEFHGKLDPDLYAVQLHFLGRYYNTATIAVEIGGGYGDAVIIPLRDGRDGRQPYPKLYRHIMSTQPSLDEARRFGYPMNSHTRPLVISQIEKAIREKALPFLPKRLVDECQTFVHTGSLPSPRAADGANDDCVMAAAITLEMYRLYGSHPERDKRLEKFLRRKREKKPLYPWQTAA